MVLLKNQFFRRGVTVAKALILFGALTGATAVAASPYDIAHESIVASLEIKIGQNDSPNRLTYYTREELIAQQRPFGGRDN